LDLTLTEELIDEGTARDFVNRVQNLRKESGLEVTDRIHILLTAPEATRRAIERNLVYICAEVLADGIQVAEDQGVEGYSEVELDNGEQLKVLLQKLQNQ
jgi:isoleucyl-tRNA synthetase